MGRYGAAVRFVALVSVQWLLVGAYVYAAVAYLATDAQYFPEQAPPGWSWPAVVVVAFGFLPAAMCLVFSVPGLPALRADRRRQVVLAGTSAATFVMLLVMATPPGWELFDWYVS